VLQDSIIARDEPFSPAPLGAGEVKGVERISRATFLNALSLCFFIALLLLRMNIGIIEPDRHPAIGGAREFFAPRALDPWVHFVTNGAMPSHSRP
jgi:hypothetical protein